MGYITQSKNGVTLRLHIQPNASKTELAGMYGDRLKIRLNAPPVDGKANEELIRFLSEILSVSKFQIRITAGLSGRQKTVEISGIKEIFIPISGKLG